VGRRDAALDRHDRRRRQAGTDSMKRFRLKMFSDNFFNFFPLNFGQIFIPKKLKSVHLATLG
jgi:hypothetical protein